MNDQQSLGYAELSVQIKEIRQDRHDRQYKQTRESNRYPFFSLLLQYPVNDCRPPCREQWQSHFPATLPVLSVLLFLLPMWYDWAKTRPRSCTCGGCDQPR